MRTTIPVATVIAAYLRLRHQEDMALNDLLEIIEPDDDSPCPPPTVEGIQAAARAHRAAMHERIGFEVPDDVDMIDLIGFTTSWIVDANMEVLAIEQGHRESWPPGWRDACNGMAAGLAEAVWANSALHDNAADDDEAEQWIAEYLEGGESA